MSTLSLFFGTKQIPAEEEGESSAVPVADWLHLEAAIMAEAGRTAAEIAARLRDLKEVVADWEERSGVRVPEGEPWRWSRAELEGYIASRSGEW